MYFVRIDLIRISLFVMMHIVYKQSQYVNIQKICTHIFATIEIINVRMYILLLYPILNVPYRCSMLKGIKIATIARGIILNFATYIHLLFSQNASIICLSRLEELILYLSREYTLRNTGINNMAAIKRR